MGFCLAVSVASLPDWSLLFAKEPTSAEDSTQSINMDKNADLGPPEKSNSPKPPSSKNRILFAVLIIIAASGGYLAMNPDFLTGLSMTKTARSKVPTAPVKTAAAPGPAHSTAGVPAPASPAPVVSAPAAATTPTPLTQTAPPSAPTAPALAGIPSPKFGEGQTVTVAVPTPLTADNTGTKASPTTASPGATLVIVDADLRNNEWVYAVRMDKGVTGWVAEKNLTVK